MDPILTLTDAPDDKLRAVLIKGLDAHNREAAGYVDRRPLAVIVSDPKTGAPVGGAFGRSAFGLLFIDLVYLPVAMRGRNVGKRVMEMAEAEGRRRGCKAAVLYTLNFQAPNFYKRLGWRVFGEIPCDPPGARRFFMTKELG